jgi:hypothetical protein
VELRASEHLKMFVPCLRASLDTLPLRIWPLKALIRHYRTGSVQVGYRSGSDSEPLIEMVKRCPVVR